MTGGPHLSGCHHVRKQLYYKMRDGYNLLITHQYRNGGDRKGLTDTFFSVLHDFPLRPAAVVSTLRKTTTCNSKGHSLSSTPQCRRLRYTGRPWASCPPTSWPSPLCMRSRRGQWKRNETMLRPTSCEAWRPPCPQTDLVLSC